ncbi:F-box/FBD/LRR-repeat protein At1g13570 [Linum perenne]
MMKRLCQQQSDHINSLSSDLIQNILMRVPLKEAARTSIFSRNWRYHWRYIPKLEFNADFADLYGRGRSNKNHILLNIYKILLHHNVPITEFKLAIPGLVPCHHSDDIVRYVSNNGVQKLSLSFFEDLVPSNLAIGACFFYAVQLNHLYLGGGKFVTPSWFAGFSMLKVVILRMVYLTNDFFERFVPICPLLEELRVYQCSDFDAAELVAPCLKVFVYIGSLEKPVFKCTPLLAVLAIEQFGGEDKKGADMVALFASLPALQRLHVNFKFLKYLAGSDHVPQKLPTLLFHLRLISILEGGGTRCLEAQVVLCLLRSSPRLHTLGIKEDWAYFALRKVPVLVEMESEECLEDLELNYLKEVYIKGYKGPQQQQLLVLRFAMETARRLERIVIQYSTGLSCEDRIEVVKEVSRYKLTSPQAELIFADPIR